MDTERPTQADLITLSLDQLKCLSSPIRSQIFWCFDPNEPRSVMDVAKEIGKSAQTTHYHLHHLVDAALLIPAGERKRRSRIETLYIWAAKDVRQQTSGASKEYRAEARRSMAAVSRTMVREAELLHRVMELDPEYFRLAGFRHHSVRVTEEQAALIRERLYAIIEEVQGMEPVPDGIREHVLVFCCPTQGSSQQRLNQLKGKKAKT